MKYDYTKLLDFDLNIKSLGKPKFDSSICFRDNLGVKVENFVTDDDRVLATTSEKELKEWEKVNKPLPSFEKAGPREKIYFEPGETISAVVTCGGLCPGLNSVIRALVYMNHYIVCNLV